MKKGWKYLLAATGLTLFLCIVALVVDSSHARRHLVTCNNIDIRFHDTLAFLSADDVRAVLDRECPSLIGQRIDSVRLGSIEEILEEKSAVRSAEAWVSSDGVLHIGIVQRDPVAKLVHGNSICFMDAEGFIFPMQGNCTKEIPVFEGQFPTVGKAKSEIMELIRYMDRHSLSKRFPLIEIGPGGFLTLHPAAGPETIVFGSATSIEEKFSKIATYYKNIRPAEEAEQYRYVNVRYKGQIICRKKAKTK